MVSTLKKHRIKPAVLLPIIEDDFADRVVELFKTNVGDNFNTQSGRKLKKSGVMSIVHGCVERAFEEIKYE